METGGETNPRSGPRISVIKIRSTWESTPVSSGHDAGYLSPSRVKEKKKIRTIDKEGENEEEEEKKKERKKERH